MCFRKQFAAWLPREYSFWRKLLAKCRLHWPEIFINFIYVKYHRHIHARPVRRLIASRVSERYGIICSNNNRSNICWQRHHVRMAVNACDRVYQGACDDPRPFRANRYASYAPMCCVIPPASPATTFAFYNLYNQVKMFYVVNVTRDS